MQNPLEERVSELERRVKKLEQILITSFGTTGGANVVSIPKSSVAPSSRYPYKTTQSGNFAFTYKTSFTYMESNIIPELVKQIPLKCGKQPRDVVNIYVEFAAARPNYPDIDRLPEGRTRRNFVIILQASPRGAIRVDETMDGVVRMVAVYLQSDMKSIDYSTSYKALEFLCRAI